MTQIPPGAIAEIVTFRLAPGTDPDEFVAAARAMTPFLKAIGGFQSRTLCVDEGGDWRDHLIWSSMPDAARAAQAVMMCAEAAPFMAMIAPDSVDMRHVPVRLSVD